MIKDFLMQIKLKKNEHLRSNDKYRNMGLVKELFDRNKVEDQYIDDGTFHDLNLDILFKKIDFTSTTAGEQVLYKILREPSNDIKELDEREDNCKYFKDNEIKREYLNKILKRINTNRHSVSDLIDKPLEDSNKLKLIYNSGALFLLLSLVLFVFIPSVTSMSMYIVSMLVNIYLHFSGGKTFTGQVETVQYLGKMINSSSEVLKHLKGSPFETNSNLLNLGKKLNHIGKKVTAIYFVKSIPLLGEMISILFLVKERSFFKISKEVIKHSIDVMELYQLFGELDASLSIVDYRDTLKEFCHPNFTNVGGCYDVNDIKHPLIENAVGNDFCRNMNGIVITGSNMSGKSTFLRTIGINAVMAQTINTSLAKKYKSSFLKVITSISLSDDIHAGKSFYRSEAEAIKRIIEETNNDVTVLSLIDEIFKGTNPMERVNAASEILNYIGKRNVLSIVTTHDINLLPLISSYETYYFSETIENNQLSFDYKIKGGVSSSGNATKILEMIGYPKDITDNIYSRIQKQLKEKIS